MKISTLITLVLICSLTAPAYAGIGGKAAEELAEFVIKKFGKEAVREGAETLAGRIASAAARHGDDVIAAVRRVGPKALGLADEAGGDAPRVLRLLIGHGDDAARVLGHPQGMALFSRFGDDAVEVLIRHPGAGETLLESLGQPAVKALGAVGPQAGRRMAMMTGELSASGRAPEVMGMISTHGERAVEFIWNNKGVLTAGAALTAILANPEPYLNGTNRLAETVAQNAVKPAVVAAGNVAQEAAAFVRWSLTIALIGLGVCGGLAFKGGTLRKAARAGIAKNGFRAARWFVK